MTYFWQDKTLEQMSNSEWESLCDGCARCCLHKLEDADNEGEVYYTSIVCRYLDEAQCACTDYPNRHKNVPNCVKLTRERVTEFHWLPSSCAYRRLSQGQDLLPWHPLVSGDPNSVHEAGISVKGKVVSELFVPEEAEQEYIIQWVEA